MILGVVVMLGLIPTIVHCQFGDEAVLLHSKQCGAGPEAGTATLTIITDLEDTQPYAICANDEVYDYELQPDYITYKLVVSYTNVPNMCVFTQLPGVQSYYVMVYVPEGSLVMAETSDKIMDCTFARLAAIDTNQTVYNETCTGGSCVNITGPDPPTIDANTTIRLIVTDVLGNPVLGDLTIGRPIMLKAEMLPPFYPEEVSFQMLWCEALGGDYGYKIYPNGCGDGYVVPSDEGFTTTGRTAVTTPFPGFWFPRIRHIIFQCYFVICPSDCDGPSCLNKARKKRDIEPDPSIIRLAARISK